MNRIKQTFIFDKTQQSETEQFVTKNSTKQLDLLLNFEKIVVQPISERPKKNENYNKTLLAFKSLFNTKMDFS